LSFAIAEKSLVKSFTPMVAPEAEPDEEPDDDADEDPDDDEADDDVAEPDDEPEDDPDVDAPEADPDVDEPDDDVPDDDDDAAGDDADPLADEEAALPLPALPLLPQAASTMLAATKAATTAPLFLDTDSSPLIGPWTGGWAAGRELPMCGAQCCRTTGDHGRGEPAGTHPVDCDVRDEHVNGT
jgi:hypothetical protein